MLSLLCTRWLPGGAPCRRHPVGHPAWLHTPAAAPVPQVRNILQQGSPAGLCLPGAPHLCADERGHAAAWCHTAAANCCNLHEPAEAATLQDSQGDAAEAAVCHISWGRV